MQTSWKATFYTKNLPTWERALRVVAALSLGLLSMARWVPPSWALYAWGTAAFVAASGFAGFCPACAFAGRKPIARRNDLLG